MVQLLGKKTSRISTTILSQAIIKIRLIDKNLRLNYYSNRIPHTNQIC